MKHLSLVLCLLLSGCATQTDLVQHGNEWIQFTQTQNQWADNVAVVTQCGKLSNGFCPEGSPTQMVVMSGKLPGVVGAGMQSAALVGSSFVIRDGLKGSKTKVQQSNKLEQNASTLSNGPVTIHKVP